MKPSDVSPAVQRALNPRYICRECAIALGGEWPDGHLATCHEADCDICQKHTGLACITDWNFPGKKINMAQWD